MRQVRRDEIIWKITQGLRTTRPELRRRLASHDADVKRQAESIMAALIVDQMLGKYEILTGSPEGPPCPIISEREGGQGIAGFEG